VTSLVRKLRLGALGAAGAALAPEAARACAVCLSSTQDDTRLAFILSTGFMTFLPLGIVGGCVWWLRRRARALAAAESPQPEPALTTAVSRASSSP
jgi:hypothetical protein